MELTRTERRLWVLVILGYVVGDTITTMLGLSQGLSEANPFAVIAIGSGGVIGLVAAKALVLGISVVMFVRVPEDWRIGVPIGLLTVGMLAVIWNISMLPLAELTDSVTTTLRRQLVALT
ncbi:MAG: DUF5658 family protein [Halobacteriales archaeon]|nr:DUF5658 family protein [Halobacteriales archaeon]